MRQDLSKSHLFTYQDDVRQICRPLFENTDVRFFCYSKYWKDGSSIFLSSDAKWTGMSINMKKAICYKQIDSIEAKKSTHTIHNQIFYFPREDNKNICPIAKEYGLGTPVVIVDQSDENYELFCFASDGSNLMDFYFKNWRFLTLVKYDFLGKSKRLVADALHSKIMLGNNVDNDNNTKRCEMPFNPEKLEKSLQPKHYNVVYKGKRIGITAREFECLRCLAQGRSNKETAILLGLGSYRAVETYQNNLKERLGMSARSELVDFYLSSDLVVL
ncbi:MAG: helix-turn-helix transcriptional regulator [Pseudomonadota bacterium]